MQQARPDTVYFREIEAAELITALLVTGAILLIVWALTALARKRLRDAARTESTLDDFLLDLTHRTKLFLLVVPAIYAGVRILSIPPEILKMIRLVSNLSLIAQGALWGTGIIDHALLRYKRQRSETDPSAITTINAFRFATAIVIWIVAILAAVDNLGFNVTTLVAGLGIGGVAIALATQNILGDLFASLSIVVDKPFVIGDVIMVDNMIGVVEKIGLKTTRIRSLSGEQLIFSNGDLLRSRIRNFKRMQERRVVFRLGVTYQTPPQKLQRVLEIVREAVEAMPAARWDRGHFAAFGPSSYDFEFVYFVASPEYLDYMDIQQSVNFAIVRAFADEGIEFAYPTQTLFVAGPVKVTS